MNIKKLKHIIQEIKYPVEFDKNKIYAISSESNLTVNSLIPKVIYNMQYNTSLKNNKWITFNHSKERFYAHDDKDYIYEVEFNANNEKKLSIIDAQKEFFKIYDKNKIEFLKELKSISYKEDYEEFLETINNRNNFFEKFKDNYSIDKIFDTFIRILFEKNKSISILKTNHDFSSSKTIGEFININTISNFKLIISRDQLFSEKDPQISDNFLSDYDIKILSSFMSKVGGNISKSDWNRFNEFIPSNSIKVYRGLSWKFENLYKLENFSYYPFKLNDKINIKSKRTTSWTTDLSVADGFSGEHEYSIIIELIVKPIDIIIDTRLLNSEIRKELYQANQREVILKPGKFQAKIIEITDNGKNVITGFENIDIKMIQNITNTFANFAKKIKSEMRNFTYMTKNQSIFGDYAVEVPLIKVSGDGIQGVIEIRIDEKDRNKFHIKFNKWEPKSGFKTFDFNNDKELINYIKNYNVFKDEIIKFFLNNFKNV